MPKSFSFWLKTAIVTVLLYGVSQITSVFLPVVLAMVLSFILNPFVNFLAGLKIPVGATKRSVPRGVAVLTSFLIAGILLAAAATFVIMPFMQEFNSFARAFPNLLKKIHLVFLSWNEQFVYADIPDNVRATITQTVSDAVMYLAGLATQFLSRVLRFATTAVELVTTPVLAYYFLKDWREIKNSALTLFPANLRARAGAAINEMGMVISGYIRGQVIISAIMGMIVFSGLYILGVEYPLILGLLAALTEAIPILGPIIGALPALFLAYLASPYLALKVLVFFIVIHQLENHIIIPNVMGRTINLHPAAIILSLLVGGHFWGIVGMIVAVPIAAILKILLKHLWRYEG